MLLKTCKSHGYILIALVTAAVLTRFIYVWSTVYGPQAITSFCKENRQTVEKVTNQSKELPEETPKTPPKETPSTPPKESPKEPWHVCDLLMPEGLKYPQPRALIGRNDVSAVTPWNAPLVWEGTFDPLVIDVIYKRMEPRVAILVLAVGKYTRFLKRFLETAETYFFVGFHVTYYVLTDHEDEVPKIELAAHRKITTIKIPGAKRWQEVVLSKMKWATFYIDQQIRNETDYLFMMDVDSVFYARVGAESLSRLTATLHRGYYMNTGRDGFPYERRKESQACIPAGEGDYYYTAAVWGGYIEDMYKLVRYCHEKSEMDTKNHIEAAWQEESHLNKYFLYNKPTKVLSPEYLWSDYDQIPANIKVRRISQLVKNYAEVRPNV